MDDYKEKLLAIGPYDIERYVASNFLYVQQFYGLTFIYRPYLEEVSEWLRTTKHEYFVIEIQELSIYGIIFDEEQGAVEFKLRFTGV